MAQTTLNMLLKLRRDNVFLSTYKLEAGEPGFEISTNTLKIGDGVKTWAELPFANEATIKELIKAVDDKVKALNDTFATDEEVRVIKEALEAAIALKLDKSTYDADKLTFKTKQTAYSATGSDKKTVTGVTQNENGEVEVTFGDIDFSHNHDADYKKLQTAIEAATTDANVFAYGVAQNANGEIEVKTKAVDFSAYRTAAAQNEIDATLATKEALKVVTDELDTYGDIVTRNASEFEEAGAAAAAEGRINETLKSYYTKTEADAEFATPAEVITEVNKALADVSNADAINNITTLVEYVNENAADLTGLITEVYGDAEMTGDSRLDLVEGRLDALEADPSAGITADDIANWNGEIGAKELAQGVKDVVDTNKATWDLASTAVQSSDFENFKLDNTKAIEDAVAPKLDSKDFDAYVDVHSYTDIEIDGKVSDALAEAKSDSSSKDAVVLSEAQSYADSAVSTAIGNLGSMATEDAADYLTKTDVENALDSKLDANGWSTNSDNKSLKSPVSSEGEYIYLDPTHIELATETGASGLLSADHLTIVEGEVGTGVETSYNVDSISKIVRADGTQTETTYTFPEKSGTIALTSDVAAIDTGIMAVEAGNDIVVTPGENGKVTVAHETFTTGEYAKDPETSDKTGDQYFFTGVTVDNGHVTGANVKSLASVLETMTFILDGGTSGNA